MFIRLVFMCIIFAACFSACSTHSPKISASVTDFVPSNSGKPIIQGIVDLGGLDIAVGDTIPKQFSDGRYSPGEWLWLKGKNLATSSISINEQVIAIDKFYDGAPLFRLPTGLSPLKEHTVTISTQFGEDMLPFFSSHYIVSTDTDGKTTQLIRTTPKEKEGIEDDWISINTDAKRPLYNLISNDSQYLYLLNLVSPQAPSTQKYGLQIDTYHLAAADQPVKLASFELALNSAPTESILTADGNILIVSETGLALIDAKEPEQLSATFNINLSKNDNHKTAYVDAIAFEDAQVFAVLETYTNRVDLLRVDSAGHSSTIDSLELLPNKSIALAIDLERDPNDANTFWVLESPNYRLVGSKLADTYKSTIKNENVGPEKSSVQQLQAIQIKGGALNLGRVINTPKNYINHFAHVGLDKRMYLTATNMDLLSFEKSQTKGKNILGKVTSTLWNSIAVGRVFAIDLDTGETEDIASGVGIYYHLVDVPEFGPVFSLLKLGPSFGFPYLTPTWGIGVKRNGTYARRKMNKRAIFPPYNVGRVAYQN